MYSARTAEASPELRLRVRGPIAAADEAGVTAFGSFSQEAEAVAVATTKGIRARRARTTSQLLTVTMGPDKGTGYAEQCAVDATTIDSAIGREAAQLARASANLVELEPATTRSCSRATRSWTCSTCGYLGFTALAVQEDRARSGEAAELARRSCRSSTTAAIRPACRSGSMPRASSSSG